MVKVKVPYLVLRGGRPRWVPGPNIRKLGLKGRDLKDEGGKWLPESAAIEEAKKLNAMVQVKHSGTPPPAIMLPSISYEGSVGALVDAFLKRPKLSLDGSNAGVGGKKKLARSTRLAYHAHGRLLKQSMGDAPASAITPAMMEEFYADRIADSSVTSANAIMRSFKSFFIYGEEKLRWPIRNPVKGLEMDEAEGRLVIWTRPEIDCFIAVVDYLGWPSLGDAVILGIITSQRRNDLLPLKPGALDAGDIYRFKTSKTNREAKAKAVPMLLDRIRAMRTRKLARWGEGTSQQCEIICEATGKPYPADGSYFGKRFRAAKLIAAGGNGSNSDLADAMQLLGVADAQVATMPIARMSTLNGKWFRDLRDTAITWLAAAGCDKFEIATVSSLSLVSVDVILDKHYLVRDDAFAISAGDKLAAYLRKGG